MRKPSEIIVCGICGTVILGLTAQSLSTFASEPAVIKEVKEIGMLPSSPEPHIHHGKHILRSQVEQQTRASTATSSDISAYHLVSIGSSSPLTWWQGL